MHGSTLLSRSFPALTPFISVLRDHIYFVTASTTKNSEGFALFQMCSTLVLCADLSFQGTLAVCVQILFERAGAGFNVQSTCSLSRCVVRHRPPYFSTQSPWLLLSAVPPETPLWWELPMALCTWFVQTAGVDIFVKFKRTSCMQPRSRTSCPRSCLPLKLELPRALLFQAAWFARLL